MRPTRGRKDVEPGRLVDGRFVLDARVGVGAHGVVYRARDLAAQGRPVAIKFLLAAAPRQLRRLQREFRALASLRHPHVVSAVEIGPSDFGPYLAMEYVDGVPIDHAVARARRGAPDVWTAAGPWIGQLLATLSDVHERGIVHRDLKPSNVLVDRSGQVRVLDFGLVHLEGDSEDLTSTGDVVGTLRYMAPEQLDGRRVDARADLFSVGVLAAVLLTGRPPYRGAGIGALAVEHRRGPQRRLRALDPSIPEQVERVVTWLLKPDPGDRPPDAATALRALASAGLLPSLSDGLKAPPAVAEAFHRPVPRPREVGIVLEAAAQARSGHPRLVALVGEPGTGKSWLLAEAFRRLRWEGFSTAGVPGEPIAPSAGSAFARAISRALGLVGETSRGARFGELVATFDDAARVGSLTPVDPKAALTQRPESARGRRLLAFEGVLRLFVMAASEVPPLVVAADPVDDEDRASLDLLEHIARAFVSAQPPQAPLLVLAALRPRASARLEALRAPHPAVVRLDLGPLMDVELAALFEGEPALAFEKARAVRRLRAETEGMPGRVAGALRAWTDRGWVRWSPKGVELTRRFHQYAPAVPAAESLDGPDPTPPGAGGGPTPAAPLDLEGLPDVARDVAVRLAALGGGAELDLLEAVSGLAGWELVDALESLVALGVAEERVTSGSTIYRLAARPSATVLAAELGSDDLRSLHATAARWLQARPSLVEGYPARVARHLEHAGDAAGAAPLYLRAAELARGRQDREGAHEASERAASCAREASLPHVHMEALVGVVQECRVLSRTERGIAAARELARVVASAPGGRRYSAAAVLGEAYLLGLQGRFPEARARVEDALAGGELADEAVGDAWLRVAEVRARLGEPHAAVDAIDRAVLAFAASGDAHGEARARYDRALHAFERGRFPDALRELDELDRRPLQGLLRASVDEALGLVLLEVGDLDEAAARIHRAAAAFRDGGDLPRYANAAANSALTEVWAGRRAGPEIGEVLAFARRADLHWVVASALSTRARDEPDGAAADLRAAWRGFRKAGLGSSAALCRMSLAHALASREPARALRHARRAVAEAPVDLAPTLRWQLLAALSGLAAECGEEAEADEARRRAESTLRACVHVYAVGPPRCIGLDEAWSRRRSLAAIADVLTRQELVQACSTTGGGPEEVA